MTAGAVITLTVVLPLVLLWAAYVCTALTAHTDTRTGDLARMVSVWQRRVPIPFRAEVRAP